MKKSTGEHFDFCLTVIGIEYKCGFLVDVEKDSIPSSCSCKLGQNQELCLHRSWVLSGNTKYLNRESIPLQLPLIEKALQTRGGKNMVQFANKRFANHKQIVGETPKGFFNKFFALFKKSKIEKIIAFSELKITFGKDNKLFYYLKQPADNWIRTSKENYEYKILEHQFECISFEKDKDGNITYFKYYGL